MQTHQEATATFDYDTLVRETLSGTLDAMNACVECCDRHALPGRIALFYEGRDGTSSTHTFAELRKQAARFAGFLKAQGVQPGDRVACLLPRTPELLVVLLGTWRAGAVYVPLFTAFGSKAIEHRLATSEAKVIVTDPTNRHKLEGVEGLPPVVTVGGPRGEGIRRGDYSFWAEMALQPDTFAPVMRNGDDPFLMMFTSGTTGLAKALFVPLKALVPFTQYMRLAIGLEYGDSFWNVADPGWAYGLYYALSGPLCMGHPTTFYEGGFTVESTIGVIERREVDVLAGSPTAYRMLLAARDRVGPALKGRVRAISSAGEPLTPEVIRWCASELETVIHDHYGQTELGMVLCNFHGLSHEVRLGSAGFAMPGHRLVVVNPETLEELGAGQPGILAMDREASPMFWFGGYHQQETKAFKGKYYLTGDTVELNEDGTISFVGRADDVITTSGYRVGPFDVESALIEHPSVVEAAVVGKPDPERTELIKAFVVLSPKFEASRALAEELQQHVRKRLSAHAFPREIEFVDDLPKTPSGKIQRFLLRKQEVERATTAVA